MSHLSTAMRAATAAALVGGFACLGSATANADPSSSDVNTLAASLSKGYSTNNCNQVSGASGVLVILQCGQNTDSTGPVFGKYLLFGNSSDLASAFTNAIASDALTNCGDASSPTVWHQQNSAASAGQVACGTYQGQSEVIWTTDAKNVLSLIRAANGDTASLYTWWKANG
jgi:hypothetical protein